MKVNPFSFSNLTILFLGVALIGYFFFLWHLIKQKTPPAELVRFQKPVKRFTVVYAVYFLLLCLLAGSGFFLVNTMPPRFLLVFIPLLLMIVLISKASLQASLHFLSFLPPVFLITVQAIRIPIEVAFIQFAYDKIIPMELSIHGRNYDLLIGVLALPVGYLFWKQHRLATTAGIMFNVLGLFSLANIFLIVVLSIPTPFRMFDMLYLPVYFPGIFIVFLASYAIFLHILSLRQLLFTKKFSNTALLIH